MGNRVRGSPPDPGGPAAGLPASPRARAPRPACVFAHAHCRRRGRFLSVPRSPLAPLRRLRPPSGDGPGARGAGRRPAGPAPGGRAAVRPGLTRAEARARPRSRRPGPRGRAAAAAAQDGGTRARPGPSAARRPGRGARVSEAPGAAFSWARLSRRPGAPPRSSGLGGGGAGTPRETRRSAPRARLGSPGADRRVAAG